MRTSIVTVACSTGERYLSTALAAEAKALVQAGIDVIQLDARSDAAARKLAVLFWCMLTRGQDYAHQQPSLTAQKLRRLELTAGAPELHGTR